MEKAKIYIFIYISSFPFYTYLKKKKRFYITHSALKKKISLLLSEVHNLELKG